MINPTHSKRITSLYGWRIHPITKKRQFHKGIDIAPISSQEQQIVSILDGYVLKQGWTKQYGNYVIIQHHNMRSKYQHLASYITKTGQTIKEGEKIGLMGNTGASTGKHLHFEIHIIRNNKYVTTNPKEYLK